MGGALPYFSQFQDSASLIIALRPADELGGVRVGVAFGSDVLHPGVTSSQENERELLASISRHRTPISVLRVALGGSDIMTHLSTLWGAGFIP